MFKKFITLMMVLTIFTSQASAASGNSLKAAFDELSYALNVEWDQKDKAFYQAQMTKFNATVSALQTEGLTNSEMIEFLKTEVKDERVARDLETAFSMISINKMSPAEATEYMINTMKKSYSAGASWDRKDTYASLLSVAIVAGFVLLIVVASNNPSSSNGTYNPGTCNQYYQCNNFCYNDAVYGYTCQPNCYYTCY